MQNGKDANQSYGLTWSVGEQVGDGDYAVAVKKNVHSIQCLTSIQQLRLQGTLGAINVEEVKEEGRKATEQVHPFAEFHSIHGLFEFENVLYSFNFEMLC